jgi:Ca-activated chloride channel family protein
MKKRFTLLFTLLFASSLVAMSKKSAHNPEHIDDWEYNATITIDKKYARVMPTLSMASAPVAMKRTLGLSVGGAKDADNFYENIAHGYLPNIDAITYEGVFYDHYFETKSQQNCENLFCPNYTTAISKNPFTQEHEYYLSVGLDSNIKAKDFARKKLNIVVVLDISGSMGAAFNQYYYDQSHHKVMLDKEERKKSKMQLANEAIVSMMEHLREEDRFGVVLFDDQAYRAKPLRSIQTTNMEAIKKHILALKERGGTNWSAGYKEGISLIDSLQKEFKNPKEYENRIIFLTDAMPNRGELRKEGLFSIAKEASKRGIYTTFIGIGVDFNNALVERVSKTRGANYYAIHSAKAFKKRLDEEFDYMVTPLVFDLKLSLLSDSYSIKAVYGSPEANRSSGELMYVNTLFPSPSNEKGSRGGVILLKLSTTNPKKKLRLSINYHDRDQKAYMITKDVTFKEGLYHDNHAIEKAILLSRYVDLMKNFIIDMRKSCHEQIPPPPFVTLKQHCSIYPPDRIYFPMLSRWERRSCPLIVSDGYKKIFALFYDHYQTEAAKLGDSSLKREQKLLQQLLHTKVPQQKIDDWQGAIR